MLPTSQKMMFSKSVITGCSFSININVSNVPISTRSSSKQAFTIIYMTVTLTGYKLQCMSSSEHYPYNDECLYI